MTHTDDETDDELRIAFDFDGVVADDEAEKVFQSGGIDAFFQAETEKAALALKPGPLKQAASRDCPASAAGARSEEG